MPAAPAAYAPTSLKDDRGRRVYARKGKQYVRRRKADGTYCMRVLKPQRGGSGGTAVDLGADAGFEALVQPRELFGRGAAEVATVEEAAAVLHGLAGDSQARLVALMSAVVDEVEAGGGRAVYYDPGVKSLDGIARKIRLSKGSPNQARQATDVYRGSIVGNNDAIGAIRDRVVAAARRHGFRIASELNSFDKPWPDGYRDINFRVKDTNNGMLLGELQVHSCVIKKFTELVGHKVYEIVRTLPPDHRRVIVDYLDDLTAAGYDNAMKWPEIGCLDELDELQKRRRDATG